MTNQTGDSGRLQADDLQEAEKGKYLDPKAATAYALMVQAAKNQNVGWGITDAYRTYDQQVTAARTKGIYGQGGTAAVPGTSQHGWGKAIDFNNAKGSGLGANSSQFKWLQDNAAQYGFKTIPREPWHWEFNDKVWSKYNKGNPWLGVTQSSANMAQKAAGIEGLGKQNITVKGPASDYRMSGYAGNNEFKDGTPIVDKKTLELGKTPSTPAVSTPSASVGANLSARIA
jgi:hypothetical protein